ncbi:MAG: 23S rRNA (pseudouridine(1915)-N(3))-methyltransferase RlmH [Bacteroidales bacterium]|nr:23S rRNA (pseudouridine(1915)-N(3))-methyltransferase RlmH [Bacteroidales bacterium]
MKITLLTVGKTDIKWVKEGLEMYSGRISRYVPFSVTEIPELKNVSALSVEQIKKKEAELILRHVRQLDELVLLDERGQRRTSLAFASWLEDRLSRGGRDLVFVVGGAYGFGTQVYERADALISLSEMTFSHQIVRTIFAEQLYRAFTIIRGEPYHHQ